MIWPPLYRSIILILFCSTLVICRAEVAYAFRGCADYIIGSPTEILANGFPYQSIMGDMFKKEADVVGDSDKVFIRIIKVRQERSRS